MLTLILADAELETVPASICGHPSVVSAAQRRGKRGRELLLDSTLHHSAMERLPDGERRGRPDICHMFLQLALGSIANLEGGLETIVHTRNDEVIRVNPKTRIPKNYNRFVGLMEDLFRKGRVPAGGEPLLSMERDFPLARLLPELGATEVVALSPDAERADLVEMFSSMGDDVVCVIGGFPKGDFRSPVYELCTRKVSIYGGQLTAWTVASEVLCAYGRSGSGSGSA